MTKKISELTAVSAALAADEMEVNEAGTSKKVTITQIATLFQSIWTSLQFGGTSSSFPMLKRSTTTLQTKLADDSAFTNHEALAYMMGGMTTNTLKLASYQATVTVLNGATTGKEAAIAMPANFLPICMSIHCTVAATNACSLTDVGDDADTDSYCDGIVTNDLTSTGFKGIVGCNGVRALGDITGGVQVATTTADEVEIVVSADPGATGVTVRLNFLGVVAA